MERQIIGRKFRNIIIKLFAVTVLAAVLPMQHTRADEFTAVHTLPDENTYKSYNVGSTESFAKSSLVIDFEKQETVVTGDVLELTAQIPATALYEFHLTFQSFSSDDFEISILFDGELLFAESELLTFPSHWQNSGELRFDGSGNEITPKQELYPDAITLPARDYSGVNELPYLFELSPGTHKITLKILQGEGIINGVTLASPEQPEPYKPPENTPKNNEIIEIEGESAVIKSGRSLIPLSDGSNANVSPADPVKSRLNYIGGSNWSTAGESLMWRFNVKKAGYYSLGLNYRQNIKLGTVSYRHLMIDGKTPFEEARRFKFTYKASWAYISLGGEDPYLIYLESGPHTISLTVTPGEMSAAYSLLNEITAALGDLYVDVTMITGETVDIYRSYELFKQIPEFNDRLKKNIADLKKLTRFLENLQEKSSGTFVSTINNAIVILNQMLNQPYSAHKYVSAFYTSYTNLGALMGSMTEMPLDIERLFVMGSNAGMPKTSVGFIDGFVFQLKRFFATFASDYNTVSGSDSEENLTLWVNWGRDQAQVLNALIKESFTDKYNIGIKIEVVNATLIQGILAGKGPDCILQTSRTEPVNLAMRGALHPLSNFDDYDEVAAGFPFDAVTPYIYNGKAYALPDTQSFEMLFIREDIFSDLNLPVPKTWIEFANVITALQRNNLSAYLPQTLFPVMLLQNDLSLYDEEKGITRLTETGQIRCFTEYTEWFTKYKLPKTTESFFNRFRIGSMPMGISDYTMLTQLETAAPEIDGRWTVLPLPGSINKTGELSNISVGTGTGCAITRLSKSPKTAWEFLKWWVSAETQLSYSKELEAILGPIGRVSTSNMEAFAKLGWNRELLPQLLRQQETAQNLPELPGGYYVSRCIEQAFWNSVEQNSNPADTLLKWAAIADSEMLRKREEYYISSGFSTQ